MRHCVEQGRTSGDGPYARLCERTICELTGANQILLTTSGASALRIAALLCDIQPGDEVIMPSYCDAATANAFLSLGARPVFVEVEASTLNMDVSRVSEQIGQRTRVILTPHCAGNSCDMDRLQDIARDTEVILVEDAAEGFGARYRGQALGTLGDFGAFSFHQMADLSCGDAGALVIKDASHLQRAEIIREKGTDRSRFFRGEVDKYTWRDLGSSFVPSDLLAAFLAAQLEHVEQIHARKRYLSTLYVDSLAPLAQRELLQLPEISTKCSSNHHSVSVRVNETRTRDALLAELDNKGITALPGRNPLHDSSLARQFGYRPGMLPVTENVSRRILRLPLYYDLSEAEVTRVTEAIAAFFAVERGQ